MQYEELMKTITESDENDWLYNSDFEIYTLRSDVRITIQGDLDFGRDPYSEEWMNPFPEKSGYKNRFFIKFNNSFVVSFILVGVDSYKVFLPLPAQDLKVSNMSYHLARIINGPSPGNDYEHYFKKSGFISD